MSNNEMDEWLAYQHDAETEMRLFDGLPRSDRSFLRNARFAWNLRSLMEQDAENFTERVHFLKECECEIIAEFGDIIPVN